jgi:hypothetical protein
MIESVKMNMKQKSRPKNIIIWRDSVAAGDDVFAPHEKEIKFENNESIETTLEKILATHYLPSIQGGKATWIVVGKYSLAVIAQQWSKPYFLVESFAHTKDLIELSNDHQLEFKYWCQVEPNEVVASIEQGKPLPDMYGRDKK